MEAILVELNKPRQICEEKSKQPCLQGISNSNITKWSVIQEEIVRVISKSEKRLRARPIWNYEHDFSLNGIHKVQLLILIVSLTIPEIKMSFKNFF